MGAGHSRRCYCRASDTRKHSDSTIERSAVTAAVNPLYVAAAGIGRRVVVGNGAAVSVAAVGCQPVADAGGDESRAAVVEVAAGRMRDDSTVPSVAE